MTLKKHFACLWAASFCLLTSCTAEQLSGVLTGLQNLETTSGCKGSDGLNCTLDQALGKIQKIQDEIKAKNYVYIGRVQGDVDSLKGITLSVPYKQKKYTATTDAEGRFELHLPREGNSYPDYVGALVKGPGIQTQVINLEGNRHQTGVGISVTPKGNQQVYVEDENLYHLGDGNYGGAINSQFQYPDASGTSRSVSFNLSAEAANQSQLGIYLAIRGYENSGSQQGLYLNDQLWSTFNNSASDGSFTIFRSNLETRGLLRAGQNLIRFQSDQNSSGDYDDFEYMNLTVSSVGSISNVSQQGSSTGVSQGSTVSQNTAPPAEQGNSQSSTDDHFIVEHCKTINEKGYRYWEFSIGRSRSYVLRFQSRYQAQAAIIDPDQLEAFKAFDSFLGKGSFDNQVGQQNVNLAPGTYYLAVRNSQGENQFSIELNEQASRANRQDLSVCP